MTRRNWRFRNDNNTDRDGDLKTPFPSPDHTQNCLLVILPGSITKRPTCVFFDTAATIISPSLPLSPFPPPSPLLSPASFLSPSPPLPSLLLTLSSPSLPPLLSPPLPLPLTPSFPLPPTHFSLLHPKTHPLPLPPYPLSAPPFYPVSLPAAHQKRQYPPRGRKITPLASQESPLPSLLITFTPAFDHFYAFFLPFSIFLFYISNLPSPPPSLSASSPFPFPLHLIPYSEPPTLHLLSITLIPNLYHPYPPLLPFPHPPPPPSFNPLPFSPSLHLIPTLPPLTTPAFNHPYPLYYPPPPSPPSPSLHLIPHSQHPPLPLTHHPLNHPPIPILPPLFPPNPLPSPPSHPPLTLLSITLTPLFTLLPTLPPTPSSSPPPPSPLLPPPPPTCVDSQRCRRWRRLGERHFTGEWEIKGKCVG
ncbi:hypothetical protein C7M84_020877 [Penaeus vannamei]|uniref:Uncharacterized protein n=1 Tax=Penaeus vannamei TaxID=6689 RepID=A0A3R7SHC6_PENVA|nr:hypothetical protein C7M84_020877 [Penaeus vannamei]